MTTQPYITLRALPDLSMFQFKAGHNITINVTMRFTPLRSDIYDLCLEQHSLIDASCPFLFTEEDINSLLGSVIQVIELYSERYPGRIIRLKGASFLQSTLFRVILRAHHNLLCPLFSIDKEGKKRFFPFRRSAGDSAFLLKRRADTPLSSPPMRTSVRSRSRLFGNWVHVELQDEMGVNQPASASVG
jgi:hypothetical protein